MHFTVEEIATAVVPPVATITLGQINTIIGIISGLLGICYLLWRWNREYKGGKL